MAKQCRCHVLSIRENPADECLINEIWGQDAEIEIITIHSGGEALTYLQTVGRKLPNLIVLPVAFNEMTALEVLRTLKADSVLHCVPVVVLAGRLSLRDTHALYEEGIACVIEMPSDLPALERTFGIIKELWLCTARLPYEQQDVYPG